MFRRFKFLGLFGLLFGFAGCGTKSPDFPVAVVTGSVLCEGKPVTNVSVIFYPMKRKETGPRDNPTALVGKAGLGSTEADGTFQISTYGDGDGAVVGPHEVRVGWRGDAPSGCPCDADLSVKLMDVIVKEGEKNHFELKLLPNNGQEKRAVEKDD